MNSQEGDLQWDNWEQLKQFKDEVLETQLKDEKWGTMDEKKQIVDSLRQYCVFIRQEAVHEANLEIRRRKIYELDGLFGAIFSTLRKAESTLKMQPLGKLLSLAVLVVLNQKLRLNAFIHNWDAGMEGTVDWSWGTETKRDPPHAAGAGGDDDANQNAYQMVMVRCTAARPVPT